MKRATRQSFKLIRLLRFARNDEMGFSILEVILASALLLILGSGAVIVVTQSLNSNRQGAEYTVANQFASEGIEAVKSIKNQAYGNLTAVNTSTRGLTRNASNVWAFKGDNTTDTLVHNSGDNFIRTVKVELVNRDATPPSGNIVASGGTLDPDTKKITSTVTWNFNSARAETLSLISYLSDWRKPTNNGDGVLAYGETTSVAQPKYRIFTDSSNSFSSQANVGSSYTDAVVGKTFKIKTSPKKQEAIAGYVNSSGVLRILCFDGTNWNSEWTVNVGGTGSNEQRFDLAYETSSGDALVVYSRNVISTNELGYRTKSGSSGCGAAGWSAETQYTTVRTGAVVNWIRLESSPIAASNNIGLAWTGTGGGVSAMIWTGSSFAVGEFSASEGGVDKIGATVDSPAFDIAFESLSGNFMLVWGMSTTATTACTVGSNCLVYQRYNFSTSSWSGLTPIPTVADSGTDLDLSANPNSNELVLGAIDDGPNATNAHHMSIAYWSGSAWTGLARVDTTTITPQAGNKLVSTGWLISGATTRSVVLYADTENPTCINGFVGTGSSFARQGGAGCWFSPTPATANPQRWLDIQMDPKNKDRLLLSLSDNNSRLYAKRLVMDSAGVFTWSNSDGSAALESGLGQSTAGPFAFGYWRN